MQQNVGSLLNTHIQIKYVKNITKGDKKIMAEANFEETIKKLETIANELEKGDLNLDESVTKFEEGMKLSKTCNDILENAEKRISILIKKDEDVTEENFNVE